MVRHVALLYSVVLGPGRRVRMDDLRAMADGLGFDRVRSLVATGNLVFDAPAADPRLLEQRLETAFAARFGRHVDIILRDSSRWRRLMAGNPFSEASLLAPDRVAVRVMATGLGGFLAGAGGAFLSLSYPGSWNEGLSSGQGLMAVALVIFARWNPIRCILAALLFGAAGAIGPALQSVGISQGYYFFNAAPYILTLFIMIATARSNAAARAAPGELSIVK